MFHLKSIYLSQTATVNKFLKEGWEPFWGYRCTYKEKDTVRMYFKKMEGTSLPARTQKTTAQVEIKVDRTEFDKFIDEATDVLKGLVESVKNISEFQKHIIASSQLVEVSFGGGRRVFPGKKFVEELGQPGNAEEMLNDLDSIARNEDEDYLENSDVIITQEDHQVREAGESPAGDSYRVVDDIPDEVKTQLNLHVKTEAQEKAIDYIRNESKINITVNPIRRDGFIMVTCGSTIYEISPDGVVTTLETNANTQSLG